MTGEKMEIGAKTEIGIETEIEIGVTEIETEMTGDPLADGVIMIETEIGIEIGEDVTETMTEEEEENQDGEEMKKDVVMDMDILKMLAQDFRTWQIFPNHSWIWQKFLNLVIQRTKRKEKIFQHFLVHKVLQDSDLQLNLLAEEDSIMTLEALTEVSEAVAVEEAVEAGEDVEMTISVEVLLTWDLAVEDEVVVVDLEETGTMVMVMKVLTMDSEVVVEVEDEVVEVGKIEAVEDEVEDLVPSEIGIRKMVADRSKETTKKDSEIGMQHQEPIQENEINRAEKREKENGKVVGETPTKFPKLVMITVKMQLSQYRVNQRG